MFTAERQRCELHAKCDTYGKGLFILVQIWAIKIVILALANATNNETFSDTSTELSYETWLHSSPAWLGNNLFNCILFACYIYPVSLTYKEDYPPSLVSGREYKHPLPDGRKLHSLADPAWGIHSQDVFTARGLESTRVQSERIQKCEV